jgi:hypothetical protein
MKIRFIIFFGLVGRRDADIFGLSDPGLISSRLEIDLTFGDAAAARILLPFSSDWTTKLSGDENDAEVEEEATEMEEEEGEEIEGEEEEGVLGDIGGGEGDSGRT